MDNSPEENPKNLFAELDAHNSKCVMPMRAGLTVPILDRAFRFLSTPADRAALNLPWEESKLRASAPNA